MVKVRAELVIHGRVQGVFYRQSTQEMARARGLCGWVRNCPDGTVAAVFEGERSAVQDAIDWCHHGPPGARVSNVEVTWVETCEALSNFEVRYGSG